MEGKLPPVKVCFVALTLLLMGCHDAPRKNPFDPALTPPVEVERAETDKEEGTIFLQWERYEGQQAFAEYRVLRKMQGLEAVDTVQVIRDREQLQFIDAGDLEPETDYLYWVVVVNSAGFEVGSQQVAPEPFFLPAVNLLGAEANPRSGHIVLTWSGYAGPFFESYEVWRRSFGQESRRLAEIQEVTQTTWTDTEPVPDIEYSYFLKTLAAGNSQESQTREEVLRLTEVDLLRANFSSETASAELLWTAYTGPRFEAYEVIRRTEETLEKVVGVLTNVADTTFVDSLLDGNTKYIYNISVRTRWGDEEGEIRVPSEEKSDIFYSLTEVLSLPALSGTEKVQAVGLALDEEDQMLVGATLISTTTAKVMQAGVRLLLPGGNRFRTLFVREDGRDIKPARLSPIHMAARSGIVYVAVRLDLGDCLVGAVEYGGEVLWGEIAPTGDVYPAGFYLEEDGDVALVDREALVYYFGPDGKMRTSEDDENLPDLRKGLATDEGLPIWHIVMGYGAGQQGKDQLFVLVPDREESHILFRTLTPLAGENWIIGGRGGLEAGVGLEDGQTLSPQVIAFDPFYTRLLVLEEQGRLQMFDVRENRYITKWGGYGSGEGRFIVSPPTSIAVAVDSQGRVYVADGEERVQIFEP
ncbi:MAG: hypothetical protein HOC74_31890 [Gemmatimonadetes bacterium]|jgi:hypothetical protein|nr:hypothetical protein [Gemmatimonadota bacterium]